ncbi:MAG TPA: hydantoinase/oxoprolinase N-terminal domain-containing protein, partial [Arenicellales bacterium]|nr:hydantoinase/oxoprolinase N-terminal domain-containing protein [Arenicellales bacterium]
MRQHEPIPADNSRPQPESGYAIAVDIGGTFTDVVLSDRRGRTWVDKTLTTYDDLLDGYFQAVTKSLRTAKLKSSAVDDIIVHATTVVTNTLIQRNGAATALLVTKGFRDILSMRDENRFDMYDPQIEFPEPLVPRDLTYPVTERIRGNGEVLDTIDPYEIEQLVPILIGQGIQSVAVSFLNAYKNPVNERLVRETLNRVAPELYVSISSEVAPQIREYLRTSTTVVNAYTQPITRPYLTELVEKLKTHGFPN